MIGVPSLLLQHLSIPLTGINGGGCVRSVRDALAKVSGVEVEQVTAGSAVVSFDPALTTPEALRAVITRVGYQPRAA